jgi:hypothetical protein
MRALEGPVRVLPPACDAALAQASSYRVARGRDTLNAVSSRIEAHVDAVTIASMCERAEAMSIERRLPPASLYAI